VRPSIELSDPGGLMATSRPAPAPSSAPSSAARAFPLASVETDAGADGKRTKAYGDEGERTVCSVLGTSVDGLAPAAELDPAVGSELGSDENVPR
jgi:hypothetical protein